METFIKIIGTVALIFLIAAIFTYPLMLAINYVFAPSFLIVVFGAVKLGFWKTYLLSVITTWLFKNSN